MYLGYIMMGPDKTLCGFARMREDLKRYLFCPADKGGDYSRVGPLSGFLKTRGRRLPRQRGLVGCTTRLEEETQRRRENSDNRW